MPGLDSDVVSIIVARTALVVSAYAAFMSGFSIRHGMRAAGWPRWSVRLATAMTWIVSLFVASRVLFPAPLTTDLERAIYRVILLSSFAILVFWVVGLDATRRAIERRPSRRVRMFAEIQAVHDALASVRTADDRERFDGSLAALDRYLEPATFEYIQLTRSRLAATRPAPSAGSRPGSTAVLRRRNGNGAGRRGWTRSLLRSGRRRGGGRMRGRDWARESALGFWVPLRCSPDCRGSSWVDPS